MKFPKFNFHLFTGKKKKKEDNHKFQAASRRVAYPMEADYEEEETASKSDLTSAFIVVLILHVIAVGGVYAFKSSSEARVAAEKPAPSATQPAKSATKPAGKTDQPKTESSKQKIEVPRAERAGVVALPEPTTAPAQIAPVSGDRIHRVAPGDTLLGLAERYDMSVADIKEYNGLKSDEIRVDQVLSLPAAGKTAKKAEPAKLAEKKPEPVKPIITTKIQPVKTAITTIKKADIAPTKQPAQTAVKTTKSHTIAKGETLTSIAKKYGVSIENLSAANSVKNAKALQPGQTLKIPAK